MSVIPGRESRIQVQSNRTQCKPGQPASEHSQAHTSRQIIVDKISPVQYFCLPGNPAIKNLRQPDACCHFVADIVIVQ